MRKLCLMGTVLVAVCIGLAACGSVSQARSTWHQGAPAALRGFWRTKKHWRKNLKYWDYMIVSFTKRSAGYVFIKSDGYPLDHVQYRPLMKNYYKLHGSTSGVPINWFVAKPSANRLLMDTTIWYRGTGPTTLYRFGGRVNPKNFYPYP